ncbi:MAG: diguanylate cyclase [Clostridia bacterium]|nr:diguanylate cyclase [Clostridia bacterium]
MDIIDHNRVEKIFGNYIRYEGNVTKFTWIIFLGLILEDLFSRVYIAKQSLQPSLIAVQLLLYVLLVGVSLMKLRSIKNESQKLKTYYKVAKIVEVVMTVTLISTVYHSVFFYFVALLPLAFISLSRGFKRAVPYILLSWFVQALSQYFVSLWLNTIPLPSMFSDFFFFSLTITIQYLLFSLFCYVWGTVHSEYSRSEEENNILIERLGDKYVQLEQAKKEIQNHYDKMRETNNQLEETNRRLTSSLAEFYTLQQISQAISSIFDMNELLKFVNDVIIGVMGVYHSTIALCHGPQNKLKVQVSSIFDKKELAIVSDYINSEVLKPSTHDGHSMIDNAVNPEDYPFTQGRNIQSMICVPLLAKGNTLGIVLIEHSMKDAFDNDNVRLLEIISQQVSIAIENARLYQQMHDLATLDGLTGAYNRLYFQDNLQIEYKKAQEKGYDLSLMIFDIDHFKKFNDTNGHLFGDLVLKSISNYIMKTLRKEDILARYGGEEFVILMPHTTLEQAQEKAEDLREGISRLTITDRVISASVTISIGVSVFPDAASTPQQLIKSSDDALYEAKHAGRNRVCVAPPKMKNENVG